MPYQLSSSTDELVVSYDLRREELELLVARMHNLAEAQRKQRRSFWWIPLFAAFFGWLLFRDIAPGPALYWPLAIYALIVGYLMWSLVRSSKAMPRNIVDRLIESSGEEAVLGPMRITITPEQIRSQHHRQTVLQDWEGIRAIDSDDSGVLLWNGKSTGSFVPGRAFATDSAKDTFVNAARRWRAMHPNWKPRCPECDYILRGVDREGCPECGWRRDQPTKGVVMSGAR